MSSVSLLPEELSRPQKWLGMFEFPPLKDDFSDIDIDETFTEIGTYHNVAPLIEFYWQVSIGLDPLGEGWIHDRFTGRSHCYGFS